MLGAIIGDIVGSRFEFDNYKAKDFDFFSPNCCPTDEMRDAFYENFNELIGSCKELL